MLERIFYTWEHRLASATNNRVVRPFEWGVDWIPPNGPAVAPPWGTLSARVVEAMTASHATSGNGAPRTNPRAREKPQ